MLRQLIEYANHFLHHAYVGPSRKFHNFSASASDAEMRGASGTKIIRGDDSEASRSIRRCEIAPCVVWLQGPTTFPSSSERVDSSSSHADGNYLRSGTLDFLIGGDEGPQGQNDENDPLSNLYKLKMDAWKQRGFNSKTEGPSGSAPPLLPFVVFQVDGQSFLLNMIRKMVGFMLAVLRGGRPWWVPELAQYKNIHKRPLLEEEDKDDIATVTETLTPMEVANKETLLAQRSSFMGYCRPALLTEPFDPCIQCQIPMAPGPYLSLLNSKYTAYDVSVRGMNRRNQKRSQKAADELGGGDGGTEQATTEQLSPASHYAFYYQTDVIPLADAWGPKPSGDQPRTATVGQKRPREEETKIPTTNITDVETSAEAFYWNVIANDIAAWDSNIFLNDCDAMLALRDGRRVQNSDQASKESDTPLPPTSGGTTLADRLSSVPSLTPADAANPKLIAKVKAQIPMPSMPKSGEMTTFLRSLRIHTWNVKRDEKVAARLAQQLAIQMENKAQKQLSKEQNGTDKIGNDADGIANEPAGSEVHTNVDKATAVSQPQSFERKAQLRRKWQEQRTLLDTKAIIEMLHNRQGQQADFSSNYCDPLVDEVTEKEEDENGDDEALLLDCAGGDGETHYQNKKVPAKDLQENLRNLEGEVDPLLDQLGNEDDGWWYYGTSPLQRQRHRKLHKAAMAAIVDDRKKRDWWQV